ncbi:hypothetical protein N9Z13_08165, partial [Luminiphilus sp.]|nr:hypothetical protein [Luminiphilus sp.]
MQELITFLDPDQRDQLWEQSSFSRPYILIALVDAWYQQTRSGDGVGINELFAPSMTRALEHTEEDFQNSIATEVLVCIRESAAEGEAGSMRALKALTLNAPSLAKANDGGSPVSLLRAEKILKPSLGYAGNYRKLTLEAHERLFEP